MNKKELKIKKLVDRGVYDPKTIAQKLGYKGNALTHGIEEVNNVLGKLGIV